MTNFFFTLLLISCGTFDTACKKIPNHFPLAISLLAILRIIQTPTLCADCICGFFLLSVPMLLLCIRHGGLGGGDIKLTAACGLYLGTEVLLWGTFFSALGALVVQLALRLRRFASANKSKKSEPKTFAFGPYLAAGYVLALWLI